MTDWSLGPPSARYSWSTQIFDIWRDYMEYGQRNAHGIIDMLLWPDHLFCMHFDWGEFLSLHKLVLAMRHEFLMKTILLFVGLYDGFITHLFLLSSNPSLHILISKFCSIMEVVDTGDNDCPGKLLRIWAPIPPWLQQPTCCNHYCGASDFSLHCSPLDGRCIGGLQWGGSKSHFRCCGPLWASHHRPWKAVTENEVGGWVNGSALNQPGGASCIGAKNLQRTGKELAMKTKNINFLPRCKEPVQRICVHVTFFVIQSDPQTSPPTSQNDPKKARIGNFGKICSKWHFDDGRKKIAKKISFVRFANKNNVLALFIFLPSGTPKVFHLRNTLNQITATR